jgi:3-oxoacyl-[acyl-carrier-protein] synthase III
MTRKIRIESLGVRLPEKVVTTEELMASCRRRPRLDLERITGIVTRRVAVDEYAGDLAVGAARRALAMSRYAPESSTRSSARASRSTTGPTSSRSSRRRRSSSAGPSARRRRSSSTS